MKIKNTNDYLKYRAIILSKEHSELKNSYDNNQIHADEINKKINEIKSTVDEGFEMFSPKAAEELNFNKQEVKELQIRLVLLVDENKELQESIKKIEEELRIINKLINDSFENESKKNQCFDDKEENTVGEMIDKDAIKNNFNNIIDKISFCSDIVEMDPRRVKIEMMNLIDIIKKG